MPRRSAGTTRKRTAAEARRMNQRTYRERRGRRLRHRRVGRRGRRAREGAVDGRIRCRRARAGSVAAADAVHARRAGGRARARDAQHGVRADPDVSDERSRAAARERRLAGCCIGARVGGSSVHFAANYWRFRPSRLQRTIDARARSAARASPTGRSRTRSSSRTTRRSIGRSASPARRVRSIRRDRGRIRCRRCRTSRRACCSSARRARSDLHAQVAPMAILSQPYDGRSACMACGHCTYYGCEFGAKSSTLVTVIPKAVATGRCEIRTDSTAFRVETNAKGRATGVVYRDNDGQRAATDGARRRPRGEWRRDDAAAAAVDVAGVSAWPRELERQRRPVHHVQRHVEHARPLRASAQRVQGRRRQPHHPRLLRHRSEARILRRRRDRRALSATARSRSRINGLPDDVPQWGSEYKRALRDYYTHSVRFMSHITSLPRRDEHRLARRRIIAIAGAVPGCADVSRTIRTT